MDIHNRASRSRFSGASFGNSQHSKPFVPGLQALRDAGADPAVLINLLHETFHSITTMSADDVVAAYQTVEAMASYAGQMEDPMVKRLLTALKAQMAMIASMHGQNHQAVRFSAVTGQHFKNYAGL